MDVSMNAHGVAVERALGRPIMSSLHACWSFGGLAGAGAVAAAVALGVDPRLEGACAVISPVGASSVVATACLGGASLHAGGSPGRRGSRSRPAR